MIFTLITLTTSGLENHWHVKVGKKKAENSEFSCIIYIKDFAF